MTRATIKPVPGYGDALSDFNRVPVLKLADQVRCDILLPVLGCSDNSRLLRSANGSSLINRQPAGVELLQSADLEHFAGTGPVNFPPDQPGRWIGVDFYDRTGTESYLRIRSAALKVIAEMAFGDDVLWFPWFEGKLRFSTHGEAGCWTYCHVHQYG